jgi:hypothetical protein
MRNHGTDGLENPIEGVFATNGLNRAILAIFNVRQGLQRAKLNSLVSVWRSPQHMLVIAQVSAACQFGRLASCHSTHPTTMRVHRWHRPLAPL